MKQFKASLWLRVAIPRSYTKWRKKSSERFSILSKITRLAMSMAKIPKVGFPISKCRHWSLHVPSFFTLVFLLCNQNTHISLVLKMFSLPTAESWVSPANPKAPIICLHLSLLGSHRSKRLTLSTPIVPTLTYIITLYNLVLFLAFSPKCSLENQPTVKWNGLPKVQPSWPPCWRGPVIHLYSLWVDPSSWLPQCLGLCKLQRQNITDWGLKQQFSWF